MITEAIFQGTAKNIQLKSSLQNLELLLENFEKQLEELQIYLIEKAQRDEIYILLREKPGSKIMPNIISLKELDILLQNKSKYLSDGTLRLKEMNLDTILYMDQPQILNFLSERLNYKNEFDKNRSREIQLYLQVAQQTTKYEDWEILFASLHRITNLNLMELELVIETLKSIRMNFFEIDSFATTLDFTLSQNIAILLQFAKTSLWWFELDEKIVDKQLELVKEEFDNIISQVIAIKFPISISNTHNVYFQNTDILLSLLIKIIIFFILYYFIHDNIFSPPPLYLSPLLSMIFSLLFVIVFSQLDLNFIAYISNDNYFIDQKELFTVFFKMLFYFCIPSILIILLHNTMPLPKIKSLRFYERIITLLNPMLIIPAIFALLVWYDLKPIPMIFRDIIHVRIITGGCLYLLICYEFVRQWASFKFSKMKSSVIALIVTISSPGIISIIDIIIREIGNLLITDELSPIFIFLTIAGIVEIHFIFVLIYFLKTWKE